MHLLKKHNKTKKYNMRGGMCGRNLAQCSVYNTADRIECEKTNAERTSENDGVNIPDNLLYDIQHEDYTKLGTDGGVREEDVTYINESFKNFFPDGVNPALCFATFLQCIKKRDIYIRAKKNNWLSRLSLESASSFTMPDCNYYVNKLIINFNKNIPATEREQLVFKKIRIPPEGENPLKVEIPPEGENKNVIVEINSAITIKIIRNCAILILRNIDKIDVVIDEELNESLDTCGTMRYAQIVQIANNKYILYQIALSIINRLFEIYRRKCFDVNEKENRFHRTLDKIIIDMNKMLKGNPPDNTESVDGGRLRRTRRRATKQKKKVHTYRKKLKKNKRTRKYRK